MLVKLCDKNLLPVGELKSLKIKDFEVLAVNLGDRFCCLSARCTHAGAPLAEGTLNRDVLTCPWHYSQFNIQSGEVVRGPAQKSLRVYLVEEKQNEIFIDL